jgi:maltose alpha-D-glucosyltransferase/alpha-amylase
MCDQRSLVQKRDGVLALRCAWRNDEVLAVHNLTDSATEVSVHLPGPAGRELVSLFTHEHSKDPRGRHRVVLPPYGYAWYRMGGLNYLLDRRDD